MSTVLNPYLSFRAQAREAVEFYHDVFGGELTISTYGDFGIPSAPHEVDNVMHSMLTTPGRMVLMCSDVPESMDFNEGNNISVSLSGDDSEALSGWFTKLSNGGEITEPLVEAPWGDSFGQLTDRFGIRWMVNISAAG